HLAVAFPAFPPQEVTDRIVWIAGASLLAAVIGSAAAEHRWWRWLNRTAFTALALVAMLGPITETLRESWTGPAWVLGVAGAMVASWANLDALARRLSPVTLRIPLVVAAFATAAALTVSGSLVLGQLTGALAASMAALVALDRSSTTRVEIAAV